MHRLYNLVYSRSGAAIALVISLVTLLAAGLHNVADGFADVKLGSSPLIHWGGAVAIELGVIAIGLTIAVRARSGDQNYRLYSGILVFAAASIFANYDASLESLTGGTITWDAVRALDPWTLTKAALLGGAIPLMVLLVIESLRELAAEDVPPSPTTGSRRRGAGQPGDVRHMSREQVAPNGNVGVSRVQPQETHDPTSAPRGTATPETMRDIIEHEPTISASELARRLQVARATVYRWRDSLGAQRSDGEWMIP